MVTNFDGGKNNLYTPLNDAIILSKVIFSNYAFYFLFFVSHIDIMSEVKHRKHRSNFSKTAPPGGSRSTSTTGKGTVVPPDSSKNEDMSGTWTSSSWLHLGICLVGMVYCGYKHAELMYTIHENNMWFSNIKVTSLYKYLV